MALDPNEAAKRVLIAYRQLSEILKEPIGLLSALAHLESYNRILNTLHECFSVDKAFQNSVSHLKPLASDVEYRNLESDGRVLLATAHTFIELYLSPEEKKKAIGFHPE
jgi:hypothetical protein